MNTRLLYIGKSNKKYTYNKFYKYAGINEKFLVMTIYDNKNQPYYYDSKYSQYFEDNFRLINEEQYKQLIRKFKLTKLSKTK